MDGNITMKSLCTIIHANKKEEKYAKRKKMLTVD
jgi:hypothetical protein